VMRPGGAAASILAAAVMIVTFGSCSRAKADEEEAKPITSNVAHVSHDAAGHVVITLRDAARKEIGIATEILKPVVHPVEVRAYGTILDPVPLLQLNGNLVSAKAAFDASRAQYLRTKQLYREGKNASLRDLESAQATYLADRARLATLEQQLRNDWGAEIARATPRARSQLIDWLVERHEALARVTAPIGEIFNSSPRKAEVFVIGHEQQPLEGRVIYETPAVNPRIQGQSFLLLMEANRFPLRPGMAVVARLPKLDQPKAGVMIPRSAVVVYRGTEWVYRALEGGSFVREEVVSADVTSTGYFVTDKLQAGMRIVVAGAQTLLSEELRSQIQPED
jgi:hypothetical protein